MSATLGTSNVHLGPWVNWSLGSVRGSTVTLTRGNGALLTAFIAVFVSFAGSRIWKIAAFSIYRYLSTDLHQDGLFHQRQAILRNSSSADIAFWNLVTIAWAWRKSKSSILRRLCPLALTSLIVGLAFAVAGVFSAQISSAMGDEVLLAGTHCAGIHYSSFDIAEYETIIGPYLTTLLKSSAQRAQQCYNINASSEDCPTFVQPNLRTSVIRNASCPFDMEVCQSNTSNLIVDTGLINSHDDLGINSSPDERFSFRIVTHCAPLVIDGKYSRVVEISSLNQQWMEYYYGKQGGFNFTYEFPVNTVNLSSHLRVETAFQDDYTVFAVLARANNTDPETVGFVARPEISRIDADTGMFFLSANKIAFSAAVDDPWYSAHRGPFNITPEGTISNGAGNSSVWFADRPTTALGCTYQAQYCNPLLPGQQGCSPLMSLYSTALEPLDTDRSEISSWFQGSQLDRLNNFLDILAEFTPDLGSILNALGVAALKGRLTFSNGMQGPLPSNQWQLDVEYWTAIQLAVIQRTMIEFANKPDWPNIERYLESPLQNGTDVERDFCTSQKILSTNYTSFSTLGLILTFVIGIIFIVTSYFLESILHWVQRRWRWDNYALAEWSINETLQLQSLAHEGFGAGTWTREVGCVPTTLPKELLATLDLSDPTHPLLRAPPRSWDEIVEVEFEGKKNASSSAEEADASAGAPSTAPGGDTTASAPAHDQNVPVNILDHNRPPPADNSTDSMPFRGV